MKESRPFYWPLAQRWASFIKTVKVQRSVENITFNYGVLAQLHSTSTEIKHLATLNGSTAGAGAGVVKKRIEENLKVKCPST